jgi:DNA modification methylase
MLTNLFCGDNVEVLRREVADNSIQLTVTSPPYDNLRKYNGFTWDFEGVASELYRVTKPGGVVVWVVADATVNGSETGTSFRQALGFMQAGFNLHDTMIWNKGAFSAVGALQTRYAPVFEYMFVFTKGRLGVFNPIKDRPNKSFGRVNVGTIRLADGSVKRMSNEGKPIAEYGQRFNVWDMSAEMNRTIKHPAPFPEAIARDHIISWSNPGDTVLDPFLGSGTTGKMAFQLGRCFIGCDISPEYVEIARNRIGGSLDYWGITPGGGQDVWSNCKT